MRASGVIRGYFAMLLLISLALISVHAAVGQTPPEEERRALIVRSVLQHAEPRLRQIRAALETGSAQPRPGDACLMLDSTGQPSYAEGTLECASALLIAGQDVEVAASMIDAVLSAQDTGGKCPGGFPWRPGTSADPYATAYLAPWLAYLSKNLGDRVPQATRTRLSNALRPALVAVQRFAPGLDDPQAYLVKVAAEATLGAALDDVATRDRAAAAFSAWLKHTSEHGFSTMHEPAATCVVAAALHWIFSAPPSAGCQQGAAAALEYLYRDLALRYQPRAEMISGAVTAGHYGDFALGTGPTRYLLYAQLGRPDLRSAEPFALFLALPGFRPNQETVALAQTIDVPRFVQLRTPEYVASTYVHCSYALGTLTGFVGTNTVPVVLTYGSIGEPSAYCEITPRPARVSAVQTDNRAVICFDIDDVGFDEDRFFVHADVHLGLKTDLDAVLVNQARWTTDFAVAVETRGNVITERDGVYTAIIPIVMGPTTAKPYDQPIGPAELSWRELAGGDGRELVLRMTARSVRGREKPRDNYRIAFAIEMACREDYSSVEAFAKAIGEERRVTQEIKTQRIKVGEKTDDTRPPNLYQRPVERGNWIYETRILQSLTFSGEGFSLELLDDLEQNRPISQRVNGAELARNFIYRSPALNHLPGDPLETVLRPPPPAESTTPQQPQ